MVPLTYVYWVLLVEHVKPGSHCAIFKSPLGLYLSDCMNMMIMSHCGISVVINVRLYDSQDELKTIRSFTWSTHTRPVTANCIARMT